MNQALDVLLGVLAAIGAWYVHVRLFPWRRCPTCKGTRRIQGGGTTFAMCGRCDKEGKVRRFGAKKD